MPLYQKDVALLIIIAESEALKTLEDVSPEIAQECCKNGINIIGSYMSAKSIEWKNSMGMNSQRLFS